MAGGGDQHNSGLMPRLELLSGRASNPRLRCFALSWQGSTLLAEGYTAGTLSLTNAVGSLRGTNQVPTASGLCPADPLSLGALIGL